MINNIIIKNFKAIDTLEIKPKKFNVLVGRNNTGKTSILEAISVCMDPNSILDLFNKYGTSIINYFSDKSSIKIDINNKNVKKLLIKKATPDQIINKLKNDLVKTFDKKDKIDINSKKSDKFLAVEKIIENIDKDKINQASLDSIVLSINYSSNEKILTGRSYMDLYKDGLLELYHNKSTKKSTDHLLDIEYMSMFSYFHRLSLSKNLFTKDKKYNTIFIKDTLNSSSINKTQKLALQIENIIKNDNIIPNLKRFNFDSLVLDTKDGDKEIPMESMGDGFKSLIYILEMLYENKSNVILIEEPETHMHPGYIRELVHYLISIANKSQVQLFITTHSQDFLYMLASEDSLPEDDIKFLKNELLILQFSRYKDNTILSNLDYDDAVSDTENLLLDLRGI